MKAFRPPDNRPEEHQIAEQILGLAVIGITLAVSPLAGTAMFFIGGGALERLFRKSDFNREVKRLQKRGYVALTKTEQGWIIKILKKGRTRYKQIQIKNLKLTKPRIWDGKWRLFIFDIPEKYEYQRNAIRKKLKNLGFYNIQRSVLAYPYECREELDLIAEYYRMTIYGTYIETSYIDLDKKLRKHFQLPKTTLS